MTALITYLAIIIAMLLGLAIKVSYDLNYPKPDYYYPKRRK